MSQCCSIALRSCSVVGASLGVRRACVQHRRGCRNLIMRFLAGTRASPRSPKPLPVVADGIIDRHDAQEVPPRVTYSISEYGQSLVPLVAQLSNWGEVPLARVVSVKSA